MKYQEIVRLVNEILDSYDKATVRQIYYRLVSPPYQYMDNTRSSYTGFDSMLVKARENGDVDWHRIVDKTRNSVDFGNTFDSPRDFLGDLKNRLSNYHKFYAFDLWARQSHQPVIYLEKQALSMVLADVALPYQVRVIPGKGYNSMTQLLEQVPDFQPGKTVLLYFGDYDPSGLNITESLLARLASYTGQKIKWVRVALRKEDTVGLPPNPVKLSDTRTKKYIAENGDGCWELDALPPDELRARVKASIESFIDKKIWEEDIAKLVKERAEIQERLRPLWEQL